MAIMQISEAAARAAKDLENKLGQDEAAGRSFEFDVERAIFLTVLHRLFAPGSDRAAEQCKRDYQIKVGGKIELHQLYRAMGWLGQPLGRKEQAGATGFSPRCPKDLIE